MVALLLIGYGILVAPSSASTPGTVVYPIGGDYRTCLKRTDFDPCPPDHEIGICQTSWTKVTCVPCKHGLRQCDSTVSDQPSRCYDTSSLCSVNEDNVAVVTNLTSGGCIIECRCNEAEGFTGDPTLCVNNGHPCPPTHTRASVGGRCLPCPDGYRNPWDDGKDKCIQMTTVTLPSQKMDLSTKKSSTDSVPEGVSTTSQPNKRNSSETKSPPADDEFNEEVHKVDHKSNLLFWIIGLVVAVAILLAVGIYVGKYKSLKKKEVDEEVPMFGNGQGYEQDQQQAEQTTNETMANELYKQIKEKFVSTVNPTSLLHFLPLSANNDERFGEMERRDGREKTAQQLLIHLVKNFTDWHLIICKALRSDGIGLSFVAEEIEKKHQSLVARHA